MRADIAAASLFDWPFVVMNVLAAVVASYGLLLDSSAVVIGAMILAMLLGPISGVALALVDGDAHLLGRASLAVAGGVSVVLITAVIIGLVHKDVPVTHQMLERTSPNFFELMIALAGTPRRSIPRGTPTTSIDNRVCRACACASPRWRRRRDRILARSGSGNPSTSHKT